MPTFQIGMFANYYLYAAHVNKLLIKYLIHKKNENYEWVEYSDIDKISVKYIGEASKEQQKGLVLASFNAG